MSNRPEYYFFYSLVDSGLFSLGSFLIGSFKLTTLFSITTPKQRSRVVFSNICRADSTISYTSTRAILHRQISLGTRRVHRSLGHQRRFLLYNRGSGPRGSAIHIPYIYCTDVLYSRRYLSVSHWRTAGCGYRRPSGDAFEATADGRYILTTTSDSHLIFRIWLAFLFTAAFSRSRDQCNSIGRLGYKTKINLRNELTLISLKDGELERINNLT